MRGSVTTARITATITTLASGKMRKVRRMRRTCFFGCFMSPRIFFRDLLPLVTWMAVIYTLSTGTGGATHTDAGLDSILARYFPFLNRVLTWPERDAIHYYIRKAAHVTEYAVLGVLAVRALRQLVRGISSRVVWGGAWLFATLYAASDEFHQIFVPERTPKVTDVMLDSAGALIGIGLMVLVSKRTRRNLASAD